jgi:methionyl-tRNA formyltransferase
MRLVLFAARAVGLRIGQFLAREGVRPVGLVLDALDSDGVNQDLVDTCQPESHLVVGKAWTAANADWLCGLEADWIVLAWWPYLLKPEVFGLAKQGCLNFHPSLLPNGRGKNPNFWALVEGTPFGVTIHHVNNSIDAGPIAWQRSIPVSWEDTAFTLYQKAQDALVDLFAVHWPDLCAGQVPREPHPMGPSPYHRAGAMESASLLELDRPTTLRQLLNHLRAREFPPHPAAQFKSEGRTYEVRISIKEVKE